MAGNWAGCWNLEPEFSSQNGYYFADFEAWLEYRLLSKRLCIKVVNPKRLVVHKLLGRLVGCFLGKMLISMHRNNNNFSIFHSFFLSNNCYQDHCGSATYNVKSREQSLSRFGKLFFALSLCVISSFFHPWCSIHKSI